MGNAYACGSPDPRKGKVSGPSDGHFPESDTNPSGPQVGWMVMFLFDDSNNSHNRISSILKYDTRPSTLSWQGLYRRGQLHPETLQGAEAGEKLQKENQPHSTA